jgi:uncharacterized protein YjbI with pentapeptide repeats
MISESKGRAIVANIHLQKRLKDFEHTTRRYTSHLWRFPETRKILVQVVLRRPLYIVKWLFIITCIIAIPIILLKVIIWGYSLPFTGFNGQKIPQYEPSKTLWDWLQLLIIPAVIAIGVTIFNHLFDKRSREIASDQQQEAAMQDYLKEMSNILTSDKLGESGLGSLRNDIARTRTLIVLHGLDPLRKARVLRFLYETRLIIDNDKLFVNLSGANFSNLRIHETKLNSKFLQKTGTRISLRNANLQEAIFRDASLEQVDLRSVCLENAYMSNVDLKITWLCNKACMKKARLNGSNLYRACLREAQMEGVQLRGAYLREAHLQGANLQDADLRAANLKKAQLEGANLQRADLREADLSGTDLQRADLRGAKLQGAHFHGAELCGAKLQGAHFHRAELSNVELTDVQKELMSSGARFENCPDVSQTLDPLRDTSDEHPHDWQLQ